jgi:glycosyltransferase involved in cell wall biosynthesis
LLGWDDEIIVLHGGNMGKKQGLDNVVNAARDADARELPLRYVLLGDGNQRRRLERQAEGVQRIQFLPSVDAERYPAILRAADVLLVNERPGVAEMSLPSKITSYCAAARPILAATSSGGATAEAVRATGSGVIVEPGNPSALNTAVLELIADRQTAGRLARNGRNYAASHLAEERAMSQYDAWVAALVAPSTGHVTTSGLAP